MKSRCPDHSSKLSACLRILIIPAIAVVLFSSADAFQARKKTRSKVTTASPLALSCTTGPGLPSFSIEQNMDLMGDGYSRTTLSEARFELCQDACARDPRCRAFTYVNPAGSGNAGCLLRGELTDRDPNPRCILGIKQSGEPIRNATPAGPAGTGIAVQRRILPDGTVEIRYPDGTIKRLSRGGAITTILPNGREMTSLPVQTPAPTPPVVPIDPAALRWLDLQNQSLLGILQSLVGSDDVNSYLTIEADISPYDKMARRTDVILRLVRN